MAIEKTSQVINSIIIGEKEPGAAAAAKSLKSVKNVK
jgi:hypothetical protein